MKTFNELATLLDIYGNTVVFEITLGSDRLLRWNATVRNPKGSIVCDGTRSNKAFNSYPNAFRDLLNVMEINPLNTKQGEVR